MSTSFVRQPRAVVSVNGDDLVGWLNIETEANEFSAPDSFRVTFAMSGLPGDRGARYWSEVAEAEVEIFAGQPTDPENFTSGDLKSIFVGTVDDIEFDWSSRTISISGRDLTAKMIDFKTSEKFVNLTASGIAEKIAAKYGLETDITATSTKAGKFYATDHVDLQDERTEWDLLTYLAAREDFTTYTRGRTLYFGPRPSLDASPTFIIRRTAPTAERTEDTNYTTLKTSRTLTVAGDIKVTVKSWNAKQKKAFTKTARRRAAGGSPHIHGAKQEYSYTIPGLTPDQAQKRADTILAELSRHTLRVMYEGSGQTKLTMSEVILLEGTGTGFDQTYLPERIVRTISKDDGFSWTIEAKNKATSDEPTL